MRIVLMAILLIVFASPVNAKISTLPWGQAPGGEQVLLYTLSNASGMEVRITNYGGRVVSIRVPDREGKYANVVQGFDELAPYLNDSALYGALVGRYANRIAGASFALDGTTYRLVTRNGANVQSHGGPNGYFQRVWQADIQDSVSPRLRLSLIDPDGEMGFPGQLQVTVTYILTADNRLRVEYSASTNKDTVVNLTNHSYFNLRGHDSGTVDGEKLQVFADQFLPTDKTGMPLGEIRPVSGTDFDFRAPSALGPRLASNSQQMTQENGLDHCFVINGGAGKLRKAARLHDPESGRTLEVWTTQPGLQIYTANFVSPAARERRHYQPHGAIAFEAQHFPNSPNEPGFPSTVISPAKPLHEVTEFRFLVGGLPNSN